MAEDDIPPHLRKLPVIKVVGVSASGKSALVRGLRAAGYDAYPVSQEHSEVPTLWRQFDLTHVLIYLDVSLAAQRERRTDVTWTEEGRAIEVRRLAHAREHADLVIDTSAMDAAQVLQLTLAFLADRRTRKASTALPLLGETGRPTRTGQRYQGDSGA